MKDTKGNMQMYIREGPKEQREHMERGRDIYWQKTVTNGKAWPYVIHITNIGTYVYT